MGETNKHPLRYAQAVRLVSLRRLSNFFDSLTAALPGGRLFACPRIDSRPKNAYNKRVCSPVCRALSPYGSTAQKLR